MLASFQVIVIDRSDLGAGDFDVEFNYARIPWETGDASGGIGGLGRRTASVGWSNGSGESGYIFRVGRLADRGIVPRPRPSSANPTEDRQPASGPAALPCAEPVCFCRPSPSPPHARCRARQIGQAYIVQFTGIGGNQPYQWTLVLDPGTTLTPGPQLRRRRQVGWNAHRRRPLEFHRASHRDDRCGTGNRLQRLLARRDCPDAQHRDACPLTQATVGSAYSQVMTAAGGRPPFTWSVDAGSVPPGLTLTSDGLLAGTPTAPGAFAFQLMASSNRSDGAQPVTRGCSLHGKGASGRPHGEWRACPPVP